MHVKQSGFSLIEALFWMGGVTGMIAVLLAVASMTGKSQATYGALEDVQAVVIAVNRVYGPAQKSNGAPFAAITTDLIGPLLDTSLGLYTPGTDSGGGPFHSINGGGTIANAYGGSISLTANAAYAAMGDSYVMTVSGVPVSSCVDFVGKLTPQSVSVAVGTTDNYALSVGGKQPVDPATIATACEKEAESGATTSVFVVDM